MLEDLFLSGVLDTKDDLSILKKFSRFGQPDNDLMYTQESADSVKCQTLRNTFQLEKIVSGCESEISKICCLRRWVYQTFGENGSLLSDIVNEDTIYDEWNIFAVKKKLTNGPFQADCGTLAMIMTEVLLAMGFISRWVQCLPFDLRPYDTHCISHVWSEDYHKWIIVDAAQDVFYFNDKGIPFGLPDFRKAIINEDRIWIWSNAKKREGKDWLIKYWRKNIFRFHCLSHSCISMFSKSKIVHYYLDPLEYEISNKQCFIGGQKVEYVHTHDDTSFWKR